MTPTTTKPPAAAVRAVLKVWNALPEQPNHCMTDTQMEQLALLVDAEYADAVETLRSLKKMTEGRDEPFAYYVNQVSSSALAALDQ